MAKPDSVLKRYADAAGVASDVANILNILPDQQRQAYKQSVENGESGTQGVLNSLGSLAQQAAAPEQRVSQQAQQAIQPSQAYFQDSRVDRPGNIVSARIADTSAPSAPVDDSIDKDEKPAGKDAATAVSIMSAGNAESPMDAIARARGDLKESTSVLQPRIDRLNEMKQQAKEFGESYQGSDQQKASLQREVEQWKEDWDRRTGEGILPKRVNEELQRRFSDMETGNVNPLEWSVPGFTGQQKTPDTVRRLYEFGFREDDSARASRSNPEMSDREGSLKENVDSDAAVSGLFSDKFKGKANTPIRAFNDFINVDAANALAPLRSLANGFFNKPVMDPNAIDDGKDPASREALMMTGEQYIKYRQLGIPGRPIDEIDPNEYYNKQAEMEDNGFVPYIVTDEGLQKFHDESATMGISNVFNRLADARRSGLDYDINYGGERYSGKDFAKNAKLYDKRMANKEGQIVYSEDEANEYAIPQAMVMTDADGNEIAVANSRPTNMYTNDVGQIIVEFDDNPEHDWVFANQEDYDSTLRFRPTAEGELALGWNNIEPLVLDSGQVLRADQAKDLLENQDDYTSYGPLNIAKPTPESPLENVGDFVPWVVDLALSSAPYFALPTAASKGAADAMNNSRGWQPGYQGYVNNTYSKLSDEPTREQQVTSTLGSAIMPATEQLWGPLGKSLMGDPAKAILGKVVPKRALDSPVGTWFSGALNEGFEEVPGNLVEEFQRSGLDMYADPVTDENGNPLYDSNGRALLNSSTPLANRVSNFGADVPEALLGGFVLGGGLGLADPEFRQYVRDYNAAKRSNDRYGYTGSANVDMDALLSTNGFDDLQKRYYNSR